jgi:hypothetical protein
MPEKYSVSSYNNTQYKKPNKKPSGDSGLKKTESGETNEYISELRGATGSRNLHKMSTADTIVGMILSAYKNPILSCNWVFERRDDMSEADLLAIRALENHFFFENSFRELLNQIISFINMGFSCFEIVWQPLSFEGNTYLFPYLLQRLQTSIENINYEKGIVRQITSNNGTVEIPLKDMVFFTLNKQGIDLRGQSILRNAYTDYKEKLVYKQIMGVGIQRDACGVPVGRVPSGTDPETKEYIEFQSLIEDLASAVGGQNSIIVPDDYQIDIIQANFNSAEVKEVIKDINSNIASSTLTQFYLLGQGGNGGAFALSRDHSDMMLDGLQHIIDLVEEIFHKKVILPFVKYNFTNVDYKKINLQGLNLNKKAGMEFAEVFKKLSEAGAIRPELVDEIMIRKNLDLPELTEETINERIASKEKEDALPKKQEQPQNDDDSEEQSRYLLNMNYESVKLAESKYWDTARQRSAKISKESKSLLKYMKAILYLMQEKLISDIRRVMNTGNYSISGLREIKISNESKYKSALKKKMAGLVGLAWSNAKRKAKLNKVKLSEEMNVSDLEDKTLMSFVTNQVEIIVDGQTNGLKESAIFTANSSGLKGYTVDQAVANAERQSDHFIEGNKIIVGAEMAVINSFSFGETQFYKTIEDQLWGYVFKNDSPVTQICQSLVGKTYQKNSIELTQITPPLHPNCKSYLEPIYKKENKQKPEFDNYIPAPSIMDEKSIY